MTHGQCIARPTFTFPASERHRPSTGTKLYCLVTEAHKCEKLAQSFYAVVSGRDSNPQPLDRESDTLVQHHDATVFTYLLISASTRCSKRNSVQTCICNSFLMTTTLSPTTVSATCNNTGNNRNCFQLFCAQHLILLLIQTFLSLTHNRLSLLLMRHTYMVHHRFHTDRPHFHAT